MTRKAAAPAREPVAEAYGRLRGALLAFLRRHTGNAQAAEDLLHDVVLKALAAGEGGRAPENVTAWLYAVARNAAVDYHRRQRPTEPLPDDLPDEREQGETALTELADCLRPLAARLPPLYRDTVVAAEFEGKPLAALAAAEGVSLSAIKSRASRGRRLLHDELVACCRVVLAADGRIADYDIGAASACAPSCAPDCSD